MTSLLGQYKFANSNSSQSYSQVRVIDDLEQCGAVDKAKILFVIEKSEELSSTSSIPIAAHPHAKFRATILAWISVCLAMLAGASIGPVFKYMHHHHISPCLSASWRCQCMTFFLVPMAILESLSPSKKVAWFETKPGLPYPIIVHIIFSGLAWAGNLLTWIIGLQFTSTFKASLIACTHPLMLCLWFKITGKPVSLLEMLGVLVSFSGLCLSCVPDLLHQSADDHQTAAAGGGMREAMGILLCFAAAACEVAVLFNRIETKKHVPLFQYTAATTVIVMSCATIMSMILEGATIFCLSGTHCVWGWSSRHWVLTMLLFGFVVGLFCILGFNYALQHIPPLVFSSLALADPALTALLSWAAGLEGLPSIMSWMGGIVVMAGVGVISYGEHRREKQHDNSSHNHSTDSDSSSLQGQGYGKLQMDDSHHNVLIANSGTTLDKEVGYDKDVEMMSLDNVKNYKNLPEEDNESSSYNGEEERKQELGSSTCYPAVIIIGSGKNS